MTTNIVDPKRSDGQLHKVLFVCVFVYGSVGNSSSTKDVEIERSACTENREKLVPLRLTPFNLVLAEFSFQAQ